MTPVMPVSLRRSGNFQHLLRGLVAALALGLLGGCAAISETDCRAGNWEAVGQHDGSNGAPPERWSEHEQTCGKYGVAFDQAAWRRGYEKGIDEYCSPEHAVQVGLRGTSYPESTCPPDVAPQFLGHWQAGRVVYEQRQRVRQLEQRKAELEQALRTTNSGQDGYSIRMELDHLHGLLGEERMRLNQEEARLRKFLDENG